MNPIIDASKGDGFMNITDRLKVEHRVIERVLAALQLHTQGTGPMEASDLDLADRILDFLTTFADRCSTLR